MLVFSSGFKRFHGAMRAIVLSCILILFTLVAPIGAALSASSAFNPDWRVTLSGKAARELALPCSRPVPGPVSSNWSPMRRTIDKLEERLAPLLARELARYNSQSSPGDYYRQYAGLVIGGRRIVYVNGFRRQIVENAINNARYGGHSNPDSWRYEPVRICDGGDISFGAEYDPETGNFTNFRFNGTLPRIHH